MSHVLLVEPDRVLAKTFMSALRRSGYSVRACAAAQTAIFCADETRPDVVVLELQLVGHSGIEFLYEFRSYADWQTIPVVIVTNVPAGEFADSWSILKDELGVTAYHYKPLTDLRQLLSIVADALTVRA